ncbi:MAG: hypothetical protein WCT24_03450 [Patescibacteria group bacterium]
MPKKKFSVLHILVTNVLEVIGIIFIWRGAWYVLDALDVYLFDGIHTWTSILGVAIGIIILSFAKKEFFNGD